MRRQALNLYLGVMYAAAVGALALADWGSLIHLPFDALGGWAALVGMGLISEKLAVRLDVGRKGGSSSSSITFIPLLASVQLFGPASAVALEAITCASGEFFFRRKDPIRATFNVSQWIVAATLAGGAFTLLGGAPLGLSHTAGLSLRYRAQFVPFVAFGVVYLAVNHAAVALAIALSQQLKFADVLRDAMGTSGAGFEDLLISPIAIAVAFLYVELWVWGILVVLLPLLFVRHAYFTMVQLKEANDDLLKALVKAIETRDPYTSGHSLRVSHLAQRIAEQLGLSRSIVEQVRHAALLHDVGKIEAVYTGILMKPAALSGKERAIIESHVTKGEELLRNLASVPEAVIRAVRHHHEREDGKGYPDGLMGGDIPLGSKIIAVCDAVDAMLSDRPYRSALSLADVLQQLRTHAGKQFDPGIVHMLLASDLLGDYADVMRAARREGDGAATGFADPERWGLSLTVTKVRPQTEPAVGGGG